MTVKVQARKARIGRNPQTGTAIKNPAKKVVKALPAKALVIAAFAASWATIWALVMGMVWISFGKGDGLGKPD